MPSTIDTLLSQRYSSRRKKTWLYKKFLCDYFGITRQGYYKHVNRYLEVDIPYHKHRVVLQRTVGTHAQSWYARVIRLLRE